MMMMMMMMMMEGTFGFMGLNSYYSLLILADLP